MSKEEQCAGLLRHSKENNEFTRKCLRDAMTQLAQEMDFKEITVTKLCDRAGVSRMAFYRNYQITSDVFYEIANEMNTLIIAAVGSPFRVSTTRDWYAGTFEFIRSHREEMSLMFQENFQAEWMKIVNGYAVHDDSFPAEKKYQRLMWSGGFENTISYWLNNGMQESPEEMADYCITYLPHLMQGEI